MSKHRKKTYDSRCYDLASIFLEDVPGALDDQCKELAAEIQQTIEDWIADYQRNYEPPDPPGFEAGFAENH